MFNVHLKIIFFLDPGPVTDEYLKDYQEQYGRSDLRYCNECDQYKPPRCHHCSICRVSTIFVSSIDVCCQHGSSLSLVM